jgi:hypothetical protein
MVGDLSAAAANDFKTVDQGQTVSKAAKKEAKRKRTGKGGSLEEVDGEGAYKGPWAGWEGDQEVDEEAEKDAEEWRAEKKRREDNVEKAKERAKGAGEEKSIFHGEHLFPPASGPCSMYLGTMGSPSLNPAVALACFLSFLPCPSCSSSSRSFLFPTSRKIPHRLRWPNLYARPNRQGCLALGRCSSARLFPSQRMHPHLYRSYQGCLEYEAFPRKWASAAQWKYGHEGQGQYLVLLNFD